MSGQIEQQRVALRFDPLPKEIAGNLAGTRPIVISVEEVDLVKQSIARANLSDLLAGAGQQSKAEPFDKSEFGQQPLKPQFQLSRVIWIVDVSSSMSDHMSDGRTKLQYLIDRIQNLPDKGYFPDGCQHSVITLNSGAKVAGPWNDLASVKSFVSELTAGGSTDYSAALQETIELLKKDIADLGPQARSLIQFFTDGNDMKNHAVASELMGSINSLNATTVMAGIGIDYSLKRIVELASRAGASGWGTATGLIFPDQPDIFKDVITGRLQETLGVEKYKQISVQGDFTGLSLMTSQYREALEPSWRADFGYSQNPRAVVFENEENLLLDLKCGEYFDDPDAAKLDIAIQDIGDNPQLYELIQQGQKDINQLLVWRAVMSRDVRLLNNLQSFVTDSKLKQQIDRIIDELDGGANAEDGGTQLLYNSMTSVGSSMVESRSRPRDNAFIDTSRAGRNSRTMHNQANDQGRESPTLFGHSGSLDHLDASISSKPLPPADKPAAANYQKAATRFQPKLIGPNGQEISLQAVVNGRSLIIGRGAACNLKIEVDEVSRKHAEIKYVGGKFFLTDLNSRNGTYLNGTAIEGMQYRQLERGDVIGVTMSNRLRFHLIF